MAVQITIRDVPEAVRDELASRAALAGKSMQEYLRGELERLAGRPSVERWLEDVRARKEAAQIRLPASEIVRHRNANRR
jgi:plasmid stability protein